MTAGKTARGVDWQVLNEQFYASDPTVYFRERLNLLLLRAGRPEDVFRLLNEGVRYEGLISTELGRSSTGTGHSDELAYLITESQSILHQVSEALIRLFLGHLPGTPCPWFEVAHLRNFSDFKAQVAKLSKANWSEEMRREVGWVFIGHDNASESTTDDHREATENVARLVRLVAKTLLDDSNLYNSAKHGMALISATRSVSITSDDTGQGVGHSGASVTFLESKNDKPLRIWKETTRWVSIRRAMFLSQLVVMEIDALWAIARTRYVDADLDQVQVLTKDSLDSVIFGDMSDAGGFTSFSRSFAQEPLPRTRRPR